MAQPNRTTMKSLPALGLLGLLVALSLAVGVPPSAGADDLAQLEQQAFNAAVAAVVDSVVQILPVGGLAQLDNRVLGQGPTTGVIVRSDGYIVSSAFNFAQQPASIVVRLPDGERRPAEIIGRDTSRMLVLLKVDADAPLPVPRVASMADVQVGAWAIAVGRTYDAAHANVSVGVVSALNRMQGRAIQSDVNASASNYGGPLVDVAGRVLGVLVPMAPQAAGAGETNELAGAEFYDSGIAFAVPLEHILAALDRWIDQRDLKPGLLGIGMLDGSEYATAPTITAVWPLSPAADAGWRPDDTIIAVDGEPVTSQAELRFHTGPRYAGDLLHVTVRRGEGDATEAIETDVTLAAELPPYRHAFLGVLPVRVQADRAADSEGEAGDATDKGHETDATKDAGLAVRAIWPGSPADQAGFEVGDRITNLGDEEITSREDALAALNAKNPGDELSLAIRRGEDELKLKAALSELPTEVLSAADLPASRGSDADDEAAPAGDPLAIELADLKLPQFSQVARYYRPSAKGPQPGLVVWLGEGSEKASRNAAAEWREACDRDGLVLLAPAPADAGGWSGDDLEYLGRLLPTAIARLGVDPQRVIVAGQGKAGQLAYALAFGARRWVRGVAAIDSPLPRTLKLPANDPGRRLTVLSVETTNDPLALLVRQDQAKLAKAGYPTTQIVRDAVAGGDAPLDAATRGTIARWIDGLDRF